MTMINSNPGGMPPLKPAVGSGGASKAEGSSSQLNQADLEALMLERLKANPGVLDDRLRRLMEKLLALIQLLDSLPPAIRSQVRELIDLANTFLAKGNAGAAEFAIREAEDLACHHTSVGDGPPPKPVEKAEGAGAQGGTGFGRDKKNMDEVAAHEEQRAKDVKRLENINEKALLATIMVPPPPQLGAN
jgi:hypothetical protein